MSDEKKDCPKCETLMFKVPTGCMGLSNPPEMIWNWRCSNCGHEEYAEHKTWGTSDPL